jgi:hypothetical protein
VWGDVDWINSVQDRGSVGSITSRPALGPTQSVLGVKQQGREAGVKNVGAIHPLPLTSSWRGAQGQAEVCCEHGNELEAIVKGGEFLN